MMKDEIKKAQKKTEVSPDETWPRYYEVVYRSGRFWVERRERSEVEHCFDGPYYLQGLYTRGLCEQAGIFVRVDDKIYLEKDLKEAKKRVVDKVLIKLGCLIEKLANDKNLAEITRNELLKEGVKMKEEKIYRCDYCKEHFSDPESCKRHEQWHTMPLDLAMKILEQVKLYDDEVYSCHACPCEGIPSVSCSSCLKLAMNKVLAEIKGGSNGKLTGELERTRGKKA